MNEGTKHTQGPWAINSYQATTDTVNHAILGRANDDQRPVTIATVYPITDDGQPWSESGANARLIAAAPEMLAALQSLQQIAAQTTQDLVGFDGSEELDKAIEQARAAIEKATK